MERKPTSTSSTIGAVALLLVVLLGLYVGGYFVLGKYGAFVRGPFISRDYPYDWLAFAYWPMVRIEGAVTGEELSTMGPDTVYSSDAPWWSDEP